MNFRLEKWQGSPQLPIIKFANTNLSKSPASFEPEGSWAILGNIRASHRSNRFPVFKRQTDTVPDVMHEIAANHNAETLNCMPICSPAHFPIPVIKNRLFRLKCRAEVLMKRKRILIDIFVWQQRSCEIRRTRSRRKNDGWIMRSSE